MDPERDITHGEKVEAELTTLITRRHEKRRETEPERQELEAWQETEILHDRQRREANRLGWIQYHRQQAQRARANLEALIAEHEAAAQRLERGAA